jgi:hypothetical protein
LFGEAAKNSGYPMSTIVEPPPLPPPTRPVLAWVIGAYYVATVILGSVSLATVLWGPVLLPAKQRHFFESLTILDHAATVVIFLLHLTAAVMLVLLRRSALYLLCAAFAIDLAITANECIGHDWISGLGVSGIMAQLRAWVFDIAIILYARYLVKNRVLR